MSVEECCAGGRLHGRRGTALGSMVLPCDSEGKGRWREGVTRVGT